MDAGYRTLKVLMPTGILTCGGAYLAHSLWNRYTLSDKLDRSLRVLAITTAAGACLAAKVFIEQINRSLALPRFLEKGLVYTVALALFIYVLRSIPPEELITETLENLRLARVDEKELRTQIASHNKNLSSYKTSLESDEDKKVAQLAFNKAERKKLDLDAELLAARYSIHYATLRCQKLKELFPAKFPANSEDNYGDAEVAE